MSSNLIINPYSVSYESILANLTTYISTKPNSETWSDYFASGAGQTILELVSALGSMYAYQFILGRRESYLSLATKYTSAVGAANNSGYSTSRGNNIHLTLAVTPTETTTISKWDVLGTYGEYDVVALDDAVLNESVNTTIKVVVGNFLQETLTVQTSLIAPFQFSNSATTEDYRLILNSAEVPTSSIVSDAVNDNYVTITNVYGSMDIFYLQTGSYKYKAGDNLILQFIERNSLTNSDINISSFDLSSVTVSSFTVLLDQASVETIDSIKVKSPIFRELSSVIRARKDYSKYLLTNSSIIADANDADIFPGLISIAAIKTDGTYLTSAEQAELTALIDAAKPGGVADEIMTHPVELDKLLTVNVTKLDNSYLSSAITTYIDTILNNYSLNLEETLDLAAIEHSINQVSGVKISRISLPTTTWNSDTYYSLYDIIIPASSTGYSNVVTEFIYKTGNSEPSWPSVGNTVVDGDILWERVTEPNIMTTANTWQSGVVIPLYTYIRGVADPTKLMKAVKYINNSNSTEPSWTGTTALTYDGEIIWKKVVEANSTPTTWTLSTNYQIGDCVHPVNAGHSSEIYVCVGYRKKSGNSEPSWPTSNNTNVVDDKITWTSNDLEIRTQTINWNEYWNLSKDLTIS